MRPCYKVEFQRFFLETRQPIWQGKTGGGRENAAEDIVKYGKFDYSQFSELELRCYILIKAGMVSMTELQEVYTLDEMLKLYALYEMQLDIEKGRADELERRT